MQLTDRQWIYTAADLNNYVEFGSLPQLKSLRSFKNPRKAKPDVEGTQLMRLEAALHLGDPTCSALPMRIWQCNIPLAACARDRETNMHPVADTKVLGTQASSWNARSKNPRMG